MSNKKEKAAEVTEAQDKALGVDKQEVKCPCCGKSTLTLPLLPDPRLSDSFLACMMTGEPWRNEYKLYGGHLAVIVSVLTPSVRRMLSKALSFLNVQATRLPSEEETIEDIKTAITTFACIQEVRPSAEDMSSFHPAETVASACSRLSSMSSNNMGHDESISTLQDIRDILTTPSTMSSLPVDMAVTLLSIHTRLYSLLIENGFDSTFWSGIKLA